MSPIRVAEIQVFGTSSTVFPRPLAGSWIESRLARTLTNVHIECQVYRLQFYPLCHNAELYCCVLNNQN